AAVLLAERIYVSDTGNRRVQMFSRDGVFLDKLVNPKGREWLRKPGALAVDAQRNLYVADNGARRIRVFSATAPGVALDRQLPARSTSPFHGLVPPPSLESTDRKELLYEIGAEDKSPQGFEAIQALALDSDEYLHALVTTATNRQAVQVYAGPKLVFRFGSGMERAPGFVNATSLSLVPGTQPLIAVFDAGPRQLKSFAWLQVPSRVGGLAVQGGLKDLRLRWQKAPGSQVARYRVYGAVMAAGPYLPLKDTADTTLVLTRDAVQAALFYRVSALSVHGVEGSASQAREDLFQSGLAHYDAKRHAEAAQYFAQAWKEDSAHAPALEYLGRSLAAQGNSAEAVRQFQELARLEGFGITGVNLQAETLWQAREYPAARAALDPLVTARRGDALTYSLCGQVALALGDTVTAADCLEQSLKLNRDNAQARFALGQVYIRMGAVGNGLSEIDAAATLAPQSAALWRQAGEAWQSSGRHKEAIDRFQRALALDGASAAARLGAARSHIALRQYEPARAIARTLVGGADEAAGQYLLGAIALALKEPQEAVLALSKAANRDAKNSAVWLALAEAQRALKNDAEARTALQRAVSADPAAFEAFFRLGVLEQDNRQHAAAVAALEKAIPLQPASAEAHLALAVSLLALERYRDATEHAREAAKLAPKRIEPLLRIADGARAQGKYGEAIEVLKKAVALSADSAAAQLQLGRAYLETDVYDAAQAHLERAALLEPKNPLAHDLLGQMYLERRLFDAAIKAFTRATELGGAPEYRIHLDSAYAGKKKSLEFSANAPRLLLQDLKLERVFSASYKRYADQPVGAVTVSNASGTDYKNLKLAFHIKGYMDFPQAQEIALLAGGSSTTLPLHAAFNNKVLGIDEDTGVQVEVKLSYTQDGQPGSIELTRPLTIYGKNAIQWADFRSVGAFVTPKDDTLKDFVRQAVTQYQPGAALNRSLLQAMTLFNVLAAHGLRYQADPNSPYSKVSGEQVDYVQFPRETLKLKSGDCDDLSVLLAAALENLGIETAFVDVPGHLFLLFNTGVPAAERDRISLQDDQLVIRANQVWVPLESTLIATSFAESWAEGARKLQEAQKAKTLKVVPLKEAWAQSQPVTLAPAAYTVSLPAPDKVQPLIERERRILVSKSLERLIAPYRAMLAASPNDPGALLQIAILYAQHGLYDLAFREFDKLLAANPRSAEAHNNRGNIYYTLADYDRAFEAYAYAEELDPADGGIKLNLALVHYQRGRLKEAAEKYREAIGLNKALAGQYQGLQKLLAN
ncbi:MAG TPA: tetratricopeptide repeat protein, partial [Acidiferrobacterales bacterium]|nr:tetratricopeptide repeat protein [Acidiferrobacterales bacterium]